jgi:polysaccharide deacetylase family protein (PEP-CTERM system associated)
VLITNAMTVDVEDYYHVSVFDRTVSRDDWHRVESRVETSTQRLLDLFDEHDVKATFFVLGWVAEHRPALVREIASRGHEVASHGFGHRIVYETTPAEFREDVRRSKRILEDQTGRAVLGYRAPSYSITARSLWALDVLIDEGFQYDSSIFPIRHDRYGIPDAPRHPYVVSRETGSILEIPPSTVRMNPINLPAAGGGYFRILPYSWTRWAISRINARERRPAVFYLHPWELDADQPRLPADAFGRFRHYRNLSKTELRLRRLVREFRFAPIQSMLQSLSDRVETTTPALSFGG